MNIFTRKAASVAALSVLVVTAGGIAYAESSLGTTSSAPRIAATVPTGPAGAAAASPDRAKAGGLRGRAIHGEFVVQTRQGFATLVLARGTVMSVSNQSISVKSADGVTTTFAVTSSTRVRLDGQKSTIGAVHDGDKVGVVGTKASDGSLTARAIREPRTTGDTTTTG